MTLEELDGIPFEYLTPAQVAGVIRVNPQSIRTQAYEAPERLGFPVIQVGSRVLIPKRAFIMFMKGEIKRPPAGTDDHPNPRGERTEI